MKKLSSLIAISLLLITTKVHGETTNVIKWLKSEPATMLDIGMVKLNMRLLKMERDPAISKAYAQFDTIDEKIVVNVVSPNKSPHVKSKDYCPKIVRHVRNKAGVSFVDGKVKYAKKPSSIFATYFIHEGQKVGKTLPTLLNKIDQRFQLVVTISENEKLGHRKIKCTSGLLDKTVKTVTYE